MGKSEADVVEGVTVETEICGNAELEHVLALCKDYNFEGKIYKEVDLSGLEDIKAIDMIEASKLYERSGGFSIAPELQMEYAMIIASKAAKKPIEFFYGLPPQDALAIKNRVTRFFYGRD